MAWEFPILLHSIGVPHATSQHSHSPYSAAARVSNYSLAEKPEQQPDLTMVAVAVQPDCASPTAEAPSLTTLAVVPAPVPVPWEFLWEQEQTVLQVRVTE